MWSLLGSISSGDKVSIKGNLLTVEKIHPFLCIKRKFNGDSRNDVFQLLNDLFDMSDYHLKEQNDKKNNVYSFKFNIINGLNGLLNLRSTYIDDSRFLSIFNSSLEKVKILKKYYVEENEILKFTELEKQIFIKNNISSRSNNEKQTKSKN
tara:strand:- start:511 stop:963 length:453 start_codon:yes stop_codon:yes gene_type:complete